MKRKKDPSAIVRRVATCLKRMEEAAISMHELKLVEWIIALRGSGLSEEDLLRWTNDARLRSECIAMWKGRRWEVPPEGASLSEARARALRMNVFGPDEVAERFSVDFSPQDRDYLSVIPFPEAMIRYYWRSHILVAGHPQLNVLYMHARTKQFGFEPCDSREPVLNDTTHLRWYLFQREPTKGPLASNEEVARACELALACCVDNTFSLPRDMFVHTTSKWAFDEDESERHSKDDPVALTGDGPEFFGLWNDGSDAAGWFLPFVRS